MKKTMMNKVLLNNYQNKCGNCKFFDGVPFLFGLKGCQCEHNPKDVFGYNQMRYENSQACDKWKNKD
jgi:hypothetical protein